MGRQRKGSHPLSKGLWVFYQAPLLPMLIHDRVPSPRTAKAIFSRYSSIFRVSLLSLFISFLLCT